MSHIGKFSRTERIRLERFLAALERPEGTMTYPQLAGFLFAVCGAPDLIMPSEWLPLVFDEQDAGYRDLDEANEVLQALMGLYNWVNNGVLQRRPKLPQGCVPSGEPLDNLEPASGLSQWARGFALGYSWLEELWDEELPDELDQEFGSTLMVLSFFAKREVAEAFMRESSAEDPRLEVMAETMLALLPDALVAYADLGRSIHEARREDDDAVAREPVAVVKIGRNEPCPCGSGLKYKKCCGAALH